MSALGLSRHLGVNEACPRAGHGRDPENTAWTMKQKLAQVMLERNETRKLEGGIELDDAYLGGEKPGKPGRGSENKLSFLAAVETVEGRPFHVHLRCVGGFTKAAIGDWAKAGLAAGSHVVSDGLACFGAVTDAQCTHAVVVTSRIHRAERLSVFKWVNTVLGNVKSAITGTLRAIRAAHAARYLAEFEYRINRRFRLEEMIPRLAWVAVRTGPRPRAIQFMTP